MVGRNTNRDCREMMINHVQISKDNHDDEWKVAKIIETVDPLYHDSVY